MTYFNHGFFFFGEKSSRFIDMFGSRLSIIQILESLSNYNNTDTVNQLINTDTLFRLTY